jgi:branched-chain amino acid transport system substrate-binding protein
MMKTRATRMVSVVVAGLMTAAGAQADVIKVGGIYSLSGPAAPFGVPERDIAQALVEKANAEGSLNGHTIEFIICDDQTNPTEAARCATRLIRQSGVVAITGPTTGSGTLAAAPIAMQNEVPLLSPVGTINVTDKANKFWPWVFRTAPSDVLIIKEVLKRGIFDPGHKRVAILYQEDAYGEAGMKFAREQTEGTDVEIVAAVSAPLNAIDLTAAATNIRNANPDVILLKTSAPPLGASFVRAAKQVGITAPIVGTGSLNQRPFLNAAGTAAEGIEIVSIGNWDDPSARQKELGEIIVAAGKEPQGYAELIGSMGVEMVFEAVRRIEGEIDGNAIRDALETICDYTGTYMDGAVCYSADQHEGVFADTLISVTVEDGKFKTMR